MRHMYLLIIRGYNNNFTCVDTEVIIYIICVNLIHTDYIQCVSKKRYTFEKSVKITFQNI